MEDKLSSKIQAVMVSLTETPNPGFDVMVKKKWTQNFKQPVSCVFVQNP